MDNDRLAELILSVHSETAATRKAVEAQNEWIKEHTEQLKEHEQDINSLNSSRDKTYGGMALLSAIMAVLASFSGIRDHLPF